MSCSVADVLPRFLKRAVSFQANTGSVSPSKEDGLIPSRLAIVSFNSARAEIEASAAALHHSGQTASIARSE